MKICEYLSEKNVLTDLESAEKKEILEQFVKELKKRGLIGKEKKILDQLLKRESLGSTGMENGVALPHALTEEVKEPLISIGIVKKGMNFEAVDQMPTYVLFLILGNQDQPGLQLKILAHICRLVKETDLVERFKKIDDPSQVCKILEEEEQSIV
ncbi:PTS sugar transporter subunit IIA [bacterium]|nr:PTS sugar transporter subunit IIA [bacterium]